MLTNRDGKENLLFSGYYYKKKYCMSFKSKINENAITGNMNEHMLFIMVDKIKYSSICRIVL